MSSQAVASSSFTIPAIFSTWHQASAAYDVEAQVIVGAHEEFSAPSLSSPPTALTRSLSRTDPIDDFFGATRSPRGTLDSRHDAMSLPNHCDDVPPPYSRSSEPPAYSRFAEHPTLAMYLFKFGFLFPLFWLAGALILLSPLRAPEDWEETKTEAERQELLRSMRRTEIKWAKYCLAAFALFAAVVISVVVIVWSVKRMH
ncbi:uncharacterized protein FIBRA_06156 [Fibroporia radiculosa]|uniref:Uncharacterized protein n=1 Tax=Fibroporia radiculosa TaxID=599839 RepID=J4H3X4_9APHY|nr:uncharacterized protein FIBRA_06156 [Fibroporia radiculosa]CCM03999.1 predicted protein [Fibroporia radiculosa]